MIINSLLDNDLYSFSVNYFYMMRLPRAIGKYTFFDRNNTVYPKGFAEKVMGEIKLMEGIKVTEEELQFMENKCYYFPKFYFDYLRGYRFNSKEVEVTQDEEGHLSVTIEGHLYKTVFWEVPILAIISELYHKELGEVPNMSEASKMTTEKAIFFQENNIKFSEFGTRRRYSKQVQDMVMRELTMNSGSNFSGTSNVYFAMKYGVTPIGTMSHQLISAVGSLFGYTQANYLAMKMWQEVYQGDLGTYLIDTYTTNVFLENFTKVSANLFSGLRVDSGDEFLNTNKIIKRYRELGVDPKTKTIIFSNALSDLDQILELHTFCQNRINCAMGIGTYLTCDVVDLNKNEKIKPSNIVIKLTEAKLTEKSSWKHCVKLSDNVSKATGNKDEVELCKKTLNIY